MVGSGRAGPVGYMAFEKVEPISGQQAAQSLEKCAAVGGYSVRELVDGGHAFRLKTTCGEGVFVLKKMGAVCWVEAGQGTAKDDLTEQGLAVIEEIARGLSCEAVEFQTRRPGLVKKASALGFETKQVVMRKKVSQ